MGTGTRTSLALGDLGVLAPAAARLGSSEVAQPWVVLRPRP